MLLLLVACRLPREKYFIAVISEVLMHNIEVARIAS
jgi:hypothetical protein